MSDDESKTNPDALSSLFTVTAKKTAPQYDYSVVPSRVLPESQDDDDDGREGPGLPKKKKKPKTGKKRSNEKSRS